MAPGTHWSELSFKNVNLKSMGAPVGGGNFHPLLKVSQISICTGLKFKKGYLRKRYWLSISDPFLPFFSPFYPLSLLPTILLLFYSKTSYLSVKLNLTIFNGSFYTCYVNGFDVRLFRSEQNLDAY